MILTRKSHNCAGTAFVQGDSAVGSNLIEQILPFTIKSYRFECNDSSACSETNMAHYFAFGYIFAKKLTPENCFLFCKKYGLFNGFIFLTEQSRNFYCPTFQTFMVSVRGGGGGGKILVFHTCT